MPTKLDALLQSAASEIVDAIDQDIELQGRIEQALLLHETPSAVLTTQEYEVVIAIRKPVHPGEHAR